MIQYPIISEERAKEADLQLRIGLPIDDLGSTVRLPNFSAGLAAAVDDIDAAIGPKRVICRYALAPFLESLLVSGNFVPPAEITLQVNGLLWLRNGMISNRMPEGVSRVAREQGAQPDGSSKQ